MGRARQSVQCAMCRFHRGFNVIVRQNVFVLHSEFPWRLSSFGRLAFVLVPASLASLARACLGVWGAWRGVESGSGAHGACRTIAS